MRSLPIALTADQKKKIQVLCPWWSCHDLGSRSVLHEPQPHGSFTKFPRIPLDATHASRGWANEAVGFFRVVVALDSDANVTAGFRAAREGVIGTIFRSSVSVQPR